MSDKRNTWLIVPQRNSGKKGQNTDGTGAALIIWIIVTIISEIGAILVFLGSNQPISQFILVIIGIPIFNFLMCMILIR
jgi:hypothetical protein